MISDHAVALTDEALPSYRSVRRQGRGRVAVVQTHGQSVVRSAYATSPLRLLTPKNHGHAAWIYTSSYGGGLVDGDIVAIQATVGAHAAAFLSTQSATKVYRSPHGTEVELQANVEDGGVLVSMPDAVVCFAGARYRQTQRVSLASGAGLILVDWMTSGRRESGERWAFNEYLSHTSIHLDGQLKVYDSLALRASDGKLATRLKPYDVLAVVVVIGQLFQEHSEQILAQVQNEAVKRHADRVVTVAPINKIGCVLRIAGQSVEQVDHALRDFLHFVPRFLGDNPWARKW
tara:strand:- start:6622 stop:7488 length:867 start_codon:yes stop_codon:yes gene_type:complete